MSTSLAVATTFTAKDRMTAVLQKMTAATTTFANKTANALKKVETAEKSLFGSIERNLGQLGIGLGLWALALLW
jgi:hypothetical protein